MCIIRPLDSSRTPISRNSRASDWAVSSVVEHCLHTAGVTSSKLVPPTKNTKLNQWDTTILLIFENLKVVQISCISVDQYAVTSVIALPSKSPQVAWQGSTPLTGDCSIHQISSTHQTRQNTPFQPQWAKTLSR